VLMCD